MSSINSVSVNPDAVNDNMPNASRTNNASASSLPKLYVVKEFQSLISWVIYNHICKKPSMQKKAMEDLFGNLYHGTGSTDPTFLPFIEQAVASLSVFDVMYVKGMGSMPRLTGSPTGPVAHTVNSLLFPGSDGPVTVGKGPTADIRTEHLELANVTGANRALISGRTLLRQAKLVSATLKKADAIADTLLGPNGEYPSGTNLDDFLKRLAAKIIEEKAGGHFSVGDATEEESVKPPPVATLTQGVKARAAASVAVLPKWTYKLIPVSNWVSIALFVKKGIARHLLEDKLPLLKMSDYDKGDKKNHSRFSARKEDAAARSRARGTGRADLLQGGFDIKEHLLASAVSLLAGNGEANQMANRIAALRDQLRSKHNYMKRLERKIDFYIALDKDSSTLIELHDSKLDEYVKLESELDKLVQLSHKREAEHSSVSAQAKKMARIVQQCPPPTDIVPSVVEAPANSIVSELSPRRLHASFSDGGTTVASACLPRNDLPLITQLSQFHKQDTPESGLSTVDGRSSTNGNVDYYMSDDAVAETPEPGHAL